MQTLFWGHKTSRGQISSQPTLTLIPQLSAQTQPSVIKTYGFFYGALSLSKWSKYGRCVLCPLCHGGQRLTSARGITHADHTRRGWADTLQRGVTQCWDCTPQSAAVTRMWTRLLENDRWWFNMATLSGQTRVRVGGLDLPVSLAAKGSLGLKGHFPLPDSTVWDSVNNGSCRREDRGDHTNTEWWINRRAKMKLPSLHFITEQKLFREADRF